MDYVEYKIELNPIEPANGILMYELGETGFESFTEEDFGLMAYVQENLFNENQVNEIFEHAKTYTDEIKYSKSIIKQQNWNEVWESNFKPIKIESKCLVRAPFHDVQGNFDYEIIISPKMSFGTGHHQTTYLMLSELFEMDLVDKSVLDMGSGTGILAILASKLGVKNVDAVDIEEWAFENATENAKLNQVENLAAILGDATSLNDKKDYYDIVLANINRNILIQDIPIYVKTMKSNSELLLSGFYDSDASILIGAVSKYGFKLKAQKEKEKWCMLHFKR